MEDGIFGHEEGFVGIVREHLRKYCAEIKEESRSVIGILNKYDKNKKTILLEAHLDRIGLMVSEILDGGFVRFKALGGVDERILPASEVYIMGREVCLGVIGAVPPHLLGKDDKENKNPKISDMVIDTGLDKEDLIKKISVGDPILLDSKFVELLDGKVSSAALDNRAGMASLFKCLELIKNADIKVNVMIAFSVGEELGLQGARTLIDDIVPDLAVVVDVTHGKTHDSESLDTFELGSGVAICRGPNVDYEITNLVIELAKDNNINYEIEVAPGNTGTNAWAIQTLKKGIPCVLLSIPLRYMHTTVETIAVRDIDAAGKLLSEIVLGGIENA